jgi:hypothetical protein
LLMVITPFMLRSALAAFAIVSVAPERTVMLPTMTVGALTVQLTCITHESPATGAIPPSQFPETLQSPLLTVNVLVAPKLFSETNRVKKSAARKQFKHFFRGMC